MINHMIPTGGLHITCYTNGLSLIPLALSLRLFSLSFSFPSLILFASFSFFLPFSFIIPSSLYSVFLEDRVMLQSLISLTFIILV